MLSSRSWQGEVRWKVFHRVKERFPLLRPKLYLPYRSCKLSRRCGVPSDERSPGNLHATVCGSAGAGVRPATRWRRVTVVPTATLSHGGRTRLIADRGDAAQQVPEQP